MTVIIPPLKERMELAWADTRRLGQNLPTLRQAWCIRTKEMRVSTYGKPMGFWAPRSVCLTSEGASGLLYQSNAEWAEQAVCSGMKTDYFHSGDHHEAVPCLDCHAW